MTDFTDGDKVTATKGNNVLEGTLANYLEDLLDGYFDISLNDEDHQFAQLKRGEWNLQKFQAPAAEILEGMKIGTRFKYGSARGNWIKITPERYVYVSADGTSISTPCTVDDFSEKSLTITILEDD